MQVNDSTAIKYQDGAVHNTANIQHVYPYKEQVYNIGEACNRLEVCQIVSCLYVKPFELLLHIISAAIATFLVENSARQQMAGLEDGIAYLVKPCLSRVRLAWDCASPI